LWAGGRNQCSVKPTSFFYTVIRSGDRDAVRKLFKSLNNEVEAIMESVLSLIYFMRGAVSYTEMMNMSYAERQMISEFLDKRFKVESKNPHPVY